MRRILVSGTAMLFALSSYLLLPWDVQDGGMQRAEASAKLRVADRELKKNKEPIVTDIYERAHHIIWHGDRAYDDRVRIAVVINGDENIVVEDRVKNQIYSQLRKKFPREDFAVMKGTDVNTKLLQYAEDIYYDQRETAVTSSSHIDSAKSGAGIHFHTSVSGRDDPDVSDSYTFSNGVSFGERSFSMDSGKVTKPSRVDVNGMPVGIQPRGLADMRRSDYVRAGKECDYDYVFVMTFSNGKSRIDNHNFVLFSTNTVRKNVWMCVRFVDVENGDYLYRNDIVTEGKTHNGRVSGRVIERSVKKAVQEAMDDIAIDY